MRLDAHNTVLFKTFQGIADIQGEAQSAGMLCESCLCKRFVERVIVEASSSEEILSPRRRMLVLISNVFECETFLTACMLNFFTHTCVQLGDSDCLMHVGCQLLIKC